MNGKHIGFILVVTIIGYVASKNAAIMPQRPRLQDMLRNNFGRPRQESLGHIIDTGLLIYDTIKKSVAWLKGIKQRTKTNDEYLYDKPLDSPIYNKTELATLMMEVVLCKPYDEPQKSCISPCMPYKYYRFCWTTPKLDQGDWEVCICELRKSIQQHLVQIKHELLRKHEFLKKLKDRVLSPLEIGLIVFSVISIVTLIIMWIAWHRARPAAIDHRRPRTPSRSASLKAAARRASCALSQHLPRQTQHPESPPPVDANPVENG